MRWFIVKYNLQYLTTPMGQGIWGKGKWESEVLAEPKLIGKS